MDRFPDKNELRILFSHAAYQMAHCFSLRGTEVSHSQAWSTEDTQTQLPTADVLVISGFWQDEYLDHANRLRYIQSIGAGYDQFPLDTLKARSISLANATGVNADAVSQHAMGLILALYRQLHTGRDNQKQKIWRGMISDISMREDDLCGHTVLIVGLGAIGNRLAALSKAFGMTVVGVKRNIDDYSGPADEVVSPECFPDQLARADVVFLCCPLTDQTRELMNDRAFCAMKQSAYLVNVARGGCVNEPALLSALNHNSIAGAAIDHFNDEPLPVLSPFWALDNLIITPHTGGETRKYEENVIDILWENLGRLWDNDLTLKNQIV